MKILHLIQKPQNRGAEMFTCQISNHLVKFGHQVKIVALFEGDAVLPFHGEITYLIASAKNRFFDVSAWKKLARIVNDFQPDIVQANAGDTLKYAVFSKKIFRWKQPLVFRNASEVGRYLKSPIQKTLNSFFYKNVEFVISVSRASEQDILYHFPYLLGKTKVIPVGLETISNIEELCLKPENSQHIVHVGGFTFEKNHIGLIKIFQLLLEKHSEAHLHLVGDGPLKEEVENAVSANNLNDKVSFYGFVNDPLTYIEAADVLVLPSIIEGLPGVILEAMICKTPVVAFNVGGISEILNENTGSLISKGDNLSFTNAILEALHNKNTEQTEAAFSLVTSNFMNTDLALKFINSYNKLVLDKQ